jgi:hypothetical protein
VRDYAFSRLALLYGSSLGIVLMIAVKLVQINLSSSTAASEGRLKKIRIAVVGDPEHTSEIISRIHARPDWNYEVVGVISVGDTASGAIGSTPQLKELIHAYRLDQVFFALRSISYKEMLLQITLLKQENVTFKLLPDSMEFILGKSNVEYLEHMPLVSLDLAFNKGVNRVLKRAIDIILGALLLIPLIPFLGYSMLRFRKELHTGEGRSFYAPVKQHKMANRALAFWYILSGSMSFVGTTLARSGNGVHTLKAGFTGPVQVNKRILSTEPEYENYELYYLQNYSVWMDIDILIKTLLQEGSFLNELSSMEGS